MIGKLLIVLTFTLSLVSVGSAYAESDLYDVLGYDVGYDIENGQILLMDLDVDFAVLIIDIVSYDDGFIEINVPRGLLDATFDDEDDIFYILIDGVESDYLEFSSPDYTRTLIIPFFADDQEIEVLGTSALSSKSTTTEVVPSWVKNNAGWWSDGLLNDSEFVAAIQYLINNGVIVIQQIESVTNDGDEVPSWVKNNAGWWSDG